MATHLVTGAGSGIGQAVADLLHARGDDLILTARSDERAAALLDRYPKAEILVLDLADPGMETVLSEHRPGGPEAVDSVVHAAGVADLATVEKQTVGGFLDTLLVNLVAPTALTSWSLPALRASRGTVVFVNSTAALVANPTWAAYAASKAGLKSVADALRTEEAPHGVRVSTVLPSRTATPMQESVRRQENGNYDPADYLDPMTVAAAIVAVLDLPRDATMPEVVLRPAPRP